MGGCRCQALAMTGDASATDPACSLSPWHREFAAVAERESQAPTPPFIYRRMGAGAKQSDTKLGSELIT